MSLRTQEILCIGTFAILILFAQSSMAQAHPGIFPKGDKPRGLLLFFLTFAAIYLTLVIHEAGHLITGLVQGFRFELFVVGFLGIKRSKQSIRFFFNKNLGYMGGIAATVPVRQDPANRRKFAWVLAAGPLASILFSIGSFGFFSYSGSGAARAFWLITAATSAGIFLVTTIPYRTGMFFTDRARFQRLMSKGPTGAAEEALLIIIAQNVQDNSSKNIPLEKARLLQNDTEKLMRFWGFYYEYYYYLQNEMLNEATDAKNRLYAVKEYVPAAVWKSLGIESATEAR